MKRIALAAPLLVLVVALMQPVARAQAAGTLVIEEAGTTLLVGTRDVPDGTTVRFRVVVDQVEIRGTSPTISTFSVAAGQTTEVKLPSLKPGSHIVELTVVDPSGVGGARATFATSGKLNPAALIIVAGLVGLLLFYRRRVLEPFSRRYDRPAPDEPREDRPTS